MVDEILVFYDRTEDRLTIHVGKKKFRAYPKSTSFLALCSMFEAYVETKEDLSRLIKMVLDKLRSEGIF